MLRFLPLALLLAVPALAQAPLTRGAFASAKTPLSVGACLDYAEALESRVVRVEARVSTVCQAKGCWFILTDGGDQFIRVRFKDYKYFVPKDVRGKTALVEGELEVKKLSKREAQHYEDDRAAAEGGTARKIESGRVEVTLMATAVEMR